MTLVTHQVRPIYRPRYAPHWFYARPRGSAKWTRHSYATYPAALERAERLRELGYEIDPFKYRADEREAVSTHSERTA